jgi:hypothetical protein
MTPLPNARWRAASLGVHEYHHGAEALIVRYAHHLLDTWPGEQDERPARALANFRSFFAPHVEALRAGIAEYLEGAHPARTLTGVIWHVDAAMESLVFTDFNEQSQKCFLRFGAVELAKVLCRELEDTTPFARQSRQGANPGAASPPQQDTAGPAPETPPQSAEARAISLP